MSLARHCQGSYPVWRQVLYNDANDNSHLLIIMHCTENQTDCDRKQFDIKTLISFFFFFCKKQLSRLDCTNVPVQSRQDSTCSCLNKTFLAWLFSKEMWRYCHSPGIVGGVGIV